MQKNTLPLIDGLSIGEYAAQWGCDSSFDSAPNQTGDGELFYQFGTTNDSMAYRSDQEFLVKFLPAIERTIQRQIAAKEAMLPEYHAEADKDLAELGQLRDFVAGLLEYDEFTRSYIECALWTSEDNSDESGNTKLDDKYTIKDLAPEARAEIIRECREFQTEHAAMITASGLGASQAGHDFWLTRNRHGAGFWDRISQTTCEAYKREQELAVLNRDFSMREQLNQTCPCPYHTCQRLSEASKMCGESFLYVGDDNKIHVH